MTIENTGEYKVWLSKVQINGYALEDVPEALKTEALCLAAVQQTGWALEYVPETLKTEGLCLAAVKQNGHALQEVPEVLKTEAIYLAAVQQDGYVLQRVPDALITEAICLVAVQKHGYALRNVPEALKTESICLAAVQQDGYVLRHVPDALKTEALCIVVVQQNSDALEFVIRPTDQLVTDPKQLASWNRILMEADETDPDSKDHLQVQLINPLLKQVNKTTQLPAPVVDEIATLIEHCERLKINIEPIKALYCEKQQLAKPQSKHRLSALDEFTL